MYDLDFACYNKFYYFEFNILLLTRPSSRLAKLTRNYIEGYYALTLLVLTFLVLTLLARPYLGFIKILMKSKDFTES